MSTWSVLTATRIAPDVPRLMAIRLASVAPLPTLEQAPSPHAGNQGRSCKAAKLRPHSPVSPDCDSFAPAMVLSWPAAMGKSFSVASSHACAFGSNRPVPDAIERLHLVSPKSRRATYSPNDIQCRTWPNSAPCVSCSQRSLAGQ